jgi:hypothetical protein
MEFLLGILLLLMCVTPPLPAALNCSRLLVIVLVYVPGIVRTDREVSDGVEAT